MSHEVWKISIRLSGNQSVNKIKCTIADLTSTNSIFDNIEVKYSHGINQGKAWVYFNVVCMMISIQVEESVQILQKEKQHI